MRAARILRTCLAAGGLVWTASRLASTEVAIILIKGSSVASAGLRLLEVSERGKYRRTCVVCVLPAAVLEALGVAHVHVGGAGAPRGLLAGEQFRLRLGNKLVDLLELKEDLVLHVGAVADATAVRHHVRLGLLRAWVRIHVGLFCRVLCALQMLLIHFDSEESLFSGWLVCVLFTRYLTRY